MVAVVVMSSSNVFNAWAASIAAVGFAVLMLHACAAGVSRALGHIAFALGVSVVLAVFAAPLVPMAHASHTEQVVMRNECAGLTTSDWKYWELGCWMLPSK